MKVLSENYEGKMHNVRLDIPEEYKNLTDEERNYINFECIKRKDEVMLCEDDDVGIHVLVFDMDNRPLEVVVEFGEKVFGYAIRKFERDKENETSH